MRANESARQWAGLAVLALPCLLVALDAEVLNLAAPQLAAALRPTSVQLLWIMDSYVFVVAGALIAMGVLGDRIGRRRLLLIGAAAFGVASLAAAFATTPGQLIAARVLMGLAGASLMPSTLALIRVMFTDRRRRGIALAIWSASFSFGGIAAPLIGGVLLEHFWWGSVFAVAVPVVALLLVLGPALLPESRDPSATGFDLVGAVLSLAAVLLFVYGLKRAAGTGVSAVPMLALLLSLILGVLFVRRQRRIPQPLLDLTMFRDARVSVALGTNALSFFVQYGTQLAIAQYLQLVLGLSPLRAGMWTLPSVVAYLLSSVLSASLARHFPPGRVIAAGAAVMSAGFVVLSMGGLPALVAGTMLFSVGLAPVYILTTDLVVATVRPERAGMAAAVTETGCELGGALGIAVLGSVMVAGYRHGMADVGHGLPSGATLADAVSAAAALPAQVAAPLLDQAHAAYGSAFGWMALAAAVLAAVAAVLAATVLRPARENLAVCAPAGVVEGAGSAGVEFALVGAPDGGRGRRAETGNSAAGPASVRPVEARMAGSRPVEARLVRARAGKARPASAWRAVPRQAPAPSAEAAGVPRADR